jgi:hypothetical protein
MAINRGFWVSCDICTNGSDSMEWYKTAAIEMAKSDGWKITSAGKATCPECQEKKSTNN